jgi:hypothetical protein
VAESRKKTFESVFFEQTFSRAESPLKGMLKRKFIASSFLCQRSHSNFSFHFTDENLFTVLHLILQKKKKKKKKKLW